VAFGVSWRPAPIYLGLLVNEYSGWCVVQVARVRDESAILQRVLWHPLIL
jgi:hypothetical protein